MLLLLGLHHGHGHVVGLHVVTHVLMAHGVDIVQIIHTHVDGAEVDVGDDIVGVVIGIHVHVLESRVVHHGVGLGVKHFVVAKMFVGLVSVVLFILEEPLGIYVVPKNA